MLQAEILLRTYIGDAVHSHKFHSDNVEKEAKRLEMERYSLLLRLLITLLILIMMLPNWAPLNASHAYEKRPFSSVDAIGSLSSFDR